MTYRYMICQYQIPTKWRTEQNQTFATECKRNLFDKVRAHTLREHEDAEWRFSVFQFTQFYNRYVLKTRGRAKRCRIKSIGLLRRSMYHGQIACL